MYGTHFKAYSLLALLYALLIGPQDVDADAWATMKRASQYSDLYANRKIIIPNARM
jgi:hypothetical protein